MKDTYHIHVEDKSENTLMLTNELSNIRHENISLKVIDNAVEKICDILVGTALDVLVRNQFIQMLKILLRNHGLQTTVKLLDVTLEEQKGCIKNLEEIFLKICMKKKCYIRKN